MTDFLHFLAERPVLLADGGMGTGLFARGLTSGDSPELWNIEHPDRVAAVHREFVDAGSDIILSNSFGGSRARLKLHALQDRAVEINRAAARVAREVADAAGRPVVVAGSVGPTGELMEPLGPLTHAEAVTIFAEQARGLAEGGADVLWVETMSAPEEVTAAVEAVSATGLPIVTTLSFDTAGRTMMGLAPAPAVSFFKGLATIPAAFGANCGVGPAQLLATLVELAAAAAADDVLVAKGNCGVPEFRDGHIHYSGTPEIMAAYARLARDAGARIIGGCCGTQAVHLASMRHALDSGHRGARPDHAAIEAALGPVAFSRPDAEPAPRRRRSR